MARDKKHSQMVHTDTVRLALEAVTASPLGKIIHPKVLQCDTPQSIPTMVGEIYGAVPRGTIMRLCGVLDGILWHYKASWRFPDMVRLVALYKAAHLIFTAQDAGDLQSLGKIPTAKRLKGKRITLRDVDLTVGGTSAAEPQDKQAAPAVARKSNGAPDAQKEAALLPPNLIGAHFIALRGAADALKEMVQYGNVNLRPEDQNQLAMIVIELVRLGRLDAETFNDALHGQPLDANDRGLLALAKAFAPKGKR